MKTIAFKMKLKPGYKEEYRKRHDALWPQLRELLQEGGIRDYSIFLDEETHELFAVQKIDGNSSSQDLSKNKIVRKWWAYMADIMETHPDNAPVSTPLEQVFHMD